MRKLVHVCLRDESTREVPEELAKAVALKYHEKATTLELLKVYPKSIRAPTNCLGKDCPCKQAVKPTVLILRRAVRVLEGGSRSAVTDRYTNLSNFLYVSRLVGWFGAPAGRF